MSTDYQIKFNRKIKIPDFQEKGRALIIYGPRRVGKTTLVKNYLKTIEENKQKYDVGDDLILQNRLNTQDRKVILEYAKPYEVIAIDEAQQIKKIGIATKMIIDEYPEKKIILTGSSSFILQQTIADPLVGRNYSTILLPIAFSEIEGDVMSKKRSLEDFLVYGSYPEVLLAENQKNKEQKLKEIISSYLYKDIFAFDKLKSPELLVNITKALAFQIGSEVSISKLAKSVGETDQRKVARYVSLLQKNFIIKKVGAYSKNQRNEINKKCKYFFYDLGIRNAIIDRFQSIDNRDGAEIGALFENYIFMELYKKNILENSYFQNIFFWRDKNKHEIDIIIEKDGRIFAYECKWSNQDVKFTEFKKMYPKSETNVISKNNFYEFLES